MRTQHLRVHPLGRVSDRAVSTVGVGLAVGEAHQLPGNAQAVAGSLQYSHVLYPATLEELRHLGLRLPGQRRDRLLGDSLDFQHPVQAGNVTGGQDSAHVLAAEVLTDNDLSISEMLDAIRAGWGRRGHRLAQTTGCNRSPREWEEYIAACELR